MSGMYSCMNIPATVSISAAMETLASSIVSLACFITSSAATLLGVSPFEFSLSATFSSIPYVLKPPGLICRLLLFRKNQFLFSF